MTLPVAAPVEAVAGHPPADLKPGDRVVMQDFAEADLYPGVVWTVACAPWPVASGDLVVRLKGYRGIYLVDGLRKVMTASEVVE